ncbi:MAG: O-antigen ligase family protein [Acetobacteraceae bacterium]|nr:O-antigen ligase family protein [Acetobacteraceae bacterium]
MVVGTCAALIHRRIEWKILSLSLALLAWSFLLSTHAKTSLATALLLTAALPVIGRFLTQPLPYKVLAASILLVTIGGALFIQYMLGITWDKIGLAIFGDLTFTDRTYIWDALYPEIARHPWTGTGFGSFWATGQTLNPISNALPDAFFMSPDVINEAHNGYIDITLQAGYVGLFLTLLVFLRAMLAGCSVIGSRCFRREDRLACTMLLCMLVALAISNFTESSPSNPIGYLFVIIAVQAERWYVDPRLQQASTRLIAGDPKSEAFLSSID